jgi:hypothetical protein
MRSIFTIAMLLWLPLRWSLGQDQGEPKKIVFHVTAVHSEEATDWCTTGECSATRFTVEGYSDVKGDPAVTEYVLECVQTHVYKPTPRYTAVCQRVHAHSDYAAKLYATVIQFEEEKPQASGPAVVLYEIKSEKEVSRQKR